MEPLFLMVVDDLYEITGRGVRRVALMPGLPLHMLREKVVAGDELELRRPDGTTQRAIFTAYQIPRPVSRESNFALVISGPVDRAEVPIGTEVWWIAHAKKSSDT